MASRSFSRSSSRRAGAWSFIALLVLAGPLVAQQVDRARTEALARRATERLQALQREADQLASDERTLLGELRKLELEHQIRVEELHRATADADQMASDLATTIDRIGQLEEQERAERRDLRSRLVETYKFGQGRYLKLLLSTAVLQRIGQAARMAAALVEIDRHRIAAHQQTLKALKTTRASLEERTRQMEARRTDAQRAEQAVAAAARVRADLIHDIDRRRDLTAQLAGELQAAQQKLQLTLRDLDSGGAPGESATLPLRPFRGDLEWPVPGSVRHRFGSTAGAQMPSSNGIEIAAAEGTTALAIHEGTVAFADTFAGFGKLVILDHGSQAFSLYGKLLDIAVERGARADRGQPVGSVGSAPAGPAGLYFELRVDGQPVDPLQWLRKR